ncbi:MAG: anion permease [Candidatus Nanohaloarchaea archaeon]
MELLLAFTVAAAVFVGINIGGSSTGVAFGPSVGARLVSKPKAAGLMSLFVFLGGWTVGRNVVETMGGRIVPASQFSLTASAVILFFVGLSLLISNLSGVPASTSMTAVGAIAGLGLATNSLNRAVMAKIVSYWLVSPAVAFLAGGAIGRYLYIHLDDYFKIDRSDGNLLKYRGRIPVALEETTTRREFFSGVLVVLIACYMAFSAGASNVANAVAPLVAGGKGVLQMETGLLLGAAAISFGGFTIARKTLDTVGDGITELPLLASLVVSTVSASIITVLSAMGIPVSLAISATMCITGLGWGRASRTVKVSETLQGKRPPLKTAALQTDEKKQIGEEEPSDIPDKRLFKPEVIRRVVKLWVLTPTLSAGASYIVFTLISTTA